MNTRSHPGAIVSCLNRTASRISRFTRFRTTALPMRRLTANPYRLCPKSLRCAHRTAIRLDHDRPSRRTRWKSSLSDSRSLRFNGRRPQRASSPERAARPSATWLFPMPLKCHPTAALQSAAFQNSPPTLSLDTLAEAMLPQAATLLWLICSLRHVNHSFPIWQSLIIPCFDVRRKWSLHFHPLSAQVTGTSSQLSFDNRLLLKCRSP